MDRAIVSPCEREERTALRLGTRSRTAPADSHSMVQTTPPSTLRSGLIGTRAPSMAWSKRPTLRPPGACSVGPCHLGHAMDGIATPCSGPCHGPWTVTSAPPRDPPIRGRAGHPMVQPDHGPVGRPDAGRRSPSDRRTARTGCGGKPWYGLSAGAGGGANPEEGGGGGGELGGGRGRRCGQQVVQHQARQLLPAQPWDGPRPTMGWPVPWDGLCPIMEWPALNHGPNHGTACAQPWDGLRCQP